MDDLFIPVRLLSSSPPPSPLIHLPLQGDDPFWEAVDIWYGSTADMEWYDPQQIKTLNGNLVITMDSTSTTQSGLTSGTFFFLPLQVSETKLNKSKGSTAPFQTSDNHGLSYRSGMLQSWNKFCFTSGYIEVAVVLPGPNENTQGYVSRSISFSLPGAPHHVDCVSGGGTAGFILRVN